MLAGALLDYVPQHARYGSDALRVPDHPLKMRTMLPLKAVVGQIEQCLHPTRTQLLDHALAALGLEVVLDEHHAVCIRNSLAHLVEALGIQSDDRSLVPARDQSLHRNDRAVTDACQLRVQPAWSNLHHRS